MPVRSQVLLILAALAFPVALIAMARWHFQIYSLPPSAQFSAGLSENSTNQAGPSGLEAAPRRPAGSAHAPIADRASAISELNKRSASGWAYRWRSSGALARMSGGSYPLGTQAPIAAASKFLDIFGAAVLGVDPSTLVQIDLKREESTSQVIYQQVLDGMPVFGSRVSVFLDKNGNLVYVNSGIFSGALPPRPSRMTSAAAAASALRAALVRYAQEQGFEIAEGMYPLEYLEGHATLGYRLLSETSVGLVYKYEFTLADVGGEDMEAMVDARDATVIALRSQRRR